MFYVEMSLKMGFWVGFRRRTYGIYEGPSLGMGGTPPGGVRDPPGGGPGVVLGGFWGGLGGFVRVPRENPYLGHFRRRFPSGCTNVNPGTPPGGGPGVDLGGGYPPPGGGTGGHFGDGPTGNTWKSL